MPSRRLSWSTALQNQSFFLARIKREARRLGFFDVGVASAEDSPGHDFFMRWLTDGCHGEMSYLSRQASKRKDPRRVFPETRSVLVLGMNYFMNKPIADSPLRGRISRYAWREDYHDVLQQRLETLLGFIKEEEPSADGVCYVDTGPVMEKAWGAQTTIGWMGKHTNLISRQRGSWFFLGVILLNIALEPDSPEGNFCGTCSRCMDACPTGAIVAPYVFDSRRCISYLTIESRGPIPHHLRHNIGNRIFGCDACQEACPWNRFARDVSDENTFTGMEFNMPELIPFVRITPLEFKQRFKNSAVYRATRDGFVRNVVTALGNSGRWEAIPVLAEALQDSSALVRAAAVWALGAISPESAVKILLKTRQNETDFLVLEEIELILSGNSPDMISRSAPDSDRGTHS